MILVLAIRGSYPRLPIRGYAFALLVDVYTGWKGGEVCGVKRADLLNSSILFRSMWLPFRSSRSLNAQDDLGIGLRELRWLRTWALCRSEMR